MAGAMIAVVDDDDLVREATRGLLRSLGYAAAAFASAEDFLACASAAAADCLITDVEMPGLDGIELARRLAVSRKDLPVIFVSAYPEARIRSRSVAARFVLPKPFHEDLLIDCLQKALAGSGRVSTA